VRWVVPFVALTMRWPSRTISDGTRPFRLNPRWLPAPSDVYTVDDAFQLSAVLFAIALHTFPGEKSL